MKTETEKIVFKKMTSMSAKKLEALMSIAQDLMYVKRATYEGVQLIDKGGSDNFLLKAYWSSALIAYARPFKDGVRQQKMQTSIYANIEGATETHKYFVDQRDKLIAHSVNPFEQTFAGVFIDEAGEVKGVGELSGEMVATSKEGFNDLNQLAKLALIDLEPKIEKERKNLLAEASKLSTTDLKQLQTVKFVGPRPSDAGRPKT